MAALHATGRGPPVCRRRADPVSHRGSDGPELREEFELEQLGEIRDAARAAGAALVSHDALDGLHVAEAPMLELVVEVDKLLGEFVEVPVLLRVVVDAEPRGGDTLARHVRLARIAIEHLRGNFVTATAEQTQALL